MKKIFNSVADVQGYHIHVYFQPGSPEQPYGSPSHAAAATLAATMKSLFGADVESANRIGLVGPHTSPNYAVHIKPTGFAQIVPWLQLNSEGLSVLIHPDTGDDVKDHLESSMWLGTPLPYNNAFFERLKSQRGPRPNV